MSADCHATRPDIGEICAFPGDLSLTDDVDVIHWSSGRLSINGYPGALVVPTLEALARDILNVVLDPVPPELVTPFAEEVVSKLGPEFVMMSCDVEAWVRRRAA